MAIDFIVMPLSRYVAGDFVSPAMRLAWSAGLPYTVFGPDGRRDHPIDVPFGGSDAPSRRMAIVDTLLDDLRSSPPIAGALWDERASSDPTFHRVDPRSYEALLHESRRSTRRGPLGMFRRSPPAAHVGSALFVPNDVAPFAISSPFERGVGSTVRALAELTGRTWSADAASALGTLRAALEDSARLQLPMIVDW